MYTFFLKWISIYLNLRSTSVTNKCITGKTLTSCREVHFNIQYFYFVVGMHKSSTASTKRGFLHFYFLTVLKLEFKFWRFSHVFNNVLLFFRNMSKSNEKFCSCKRKKSFKNWTRPYRSRLFPAKNVLCEKSRAKFLSTRRGACIALTFLSAQSSGHRWIDCGYVRRH